MSRATFDSITSVRHVLRNGTDYVQLIASHDGVLIDLTARKYDTLGCRRMEHATTRMSLRDAEELRAALDDAIAESYAIDHPAQPPLWSDATVASVAGRLPKRVRGGAAV